MNLKKAIMLGVAFASTVGVAGVAIGGQNALSSIGSLPLYASVREISLNSSTVVTHANAYGGDNVQYPNGQWDNYYIAGDATHGQINISAWENSAYSTFTYDFTSGDCFLKATSKVPTTRYVWIESDEEEGEIELPSDEEEYQDYLAELDEMGELDYRVERRTDPVASWFWLIIGLNNIQSFSMTYTISHPALVNTEYYMRMDLLNGNGFLEYSWDWCPWDPTSGEFSIDQAGLAALEKTEDTIRAIRFRFHTVSTLETVTFKILTVNATYAC